MCLCPLARALSLALLASTLTAAARAEEYFADPGAPPIKVMARSRSSRRTSEPTLRGHWQRCAVPAAR